MPSCTPHYSAVWVKVPASTFTVRFPGRLSRPADTASQRFERARIPGSPVGGSWRATSANALWTSGPCPSGAAYGRDPMFEPCACAQAPVGRANRFVLRRPPSKQPPVRAGSHRSSRWEEAYGPHWWKKRPPALPHLKKRVSVGGSRATRVALLGLMGAANDHRRPYG